MTESAPNSREQLPRTADVVIIGGGVNGASVAFNLTQLGNRDVVLLERRQLGSGATGKSGALVRSHYTNEHEARLAWESTKVFEHWSEIVGHGDPGFRQTGFIKVVAPADEGSLRHNVTMLRDKIGVETSLVDPSDLREIEPLMRTEDLTLAAFEPRAGYCDPNATLYGFAKAAVANGASIHTFTEAISVIVRGDRVVGVETSAGTIATDCVVVAAGAFADRLLTPIGVELGLLPWRSQVAIFRWPPDVDHSRPHRVVIDSTNHSWFRVEGECSTLIGAETGDRRTSPEGADESLQPGYVDLARTALAARFPLFASATMRGGWTGVYMLSPDKHPIVDKIESVDGLFIIAGDSGTSFKTSPAIGVCVAEWICDGEPRLVDLHPFRAMRFAEGQPWIDQHTYAAAGEALTISR